MVPPLPNARSAELRGEQLIVSVAECKFARQPASFWTLLGPCVGVFLYDSKTQAGAALHSVLPKAPLGQTLPVSLKAKYVDSGINHALDLLHQEFSCPKEHLRAILVGGASAYKESSAGNVESAIRVLNHLGIPIDGQATGGSEGNKSFIFAFDLLSGQVYGRESKAPGKGILLKFKQEAQSSLIVPETDHFTLLQFPQNPEVSDIAADSAALV